MNAAKQTFNTKLKEFCKALVTFVREFINLGTKSVGLSESLRISEEKCAVFFLDHDP